MLTMNRHWIVTALLSLSAFPAIADVRAIYETGGDYSHKLVVEVADGGSMRVSSHRGSYVDYFLFIENEIYAVRPGPGGPDVITLDAATEIARRNRANVIVFGDDTEGSDKTASLRYRPIEAVTIAGHHGVWYDYPDSPYPDGTRIVLSDDPALLPLGPAIVAYDQATTMLSFDKERTDNLAELLSEHGVLSIWDYELTSVDFEPIARNQFAVPATPLTLADLAETTPEADASDNTEKTEVQSFVVRAQYHENALYTLLSDGRLQVWPEGAERGRDVAVPARVDSFCVLGDDLYLVAVDPADGEVRVFVSVSGTWDIATSFTEAGTDLFLAMDCSGAQPVVLSTNAIRFPIENRSVAITGGSIDFYANFTTMQHGGYLYVGVNTGEFGGRLFRFSLGGGPGERVGASNPDGTCEENELNAMCHPITGLWTDPRDPDCILATVGLVHFLPTGSVVRICGDNISMVYAKPYTIDPNWRFDPENPSTDHSSVAFYSLGGNAHGVWAVASDGIYSFGTEAEPEHRPFPGGFEFPKSGVDWSHPEFALVLTTMNQRFSVGGASLILVPR